MQGRPCSAVAVAAIIYTRVHPDPDDLTINRCITQPRPRARGMLYLRARPEAASACQAGQCDAAGGKTERTRRQVSQAQRRVSPIAGHRSGRSSRSRSWTQLRYVLKNLRLDKPPSTIAPRSPLGSGIPSVRCSCPALASGTIRMPKR